MLARAAGDPDADEIHDWLTQGNPAYRAPDPGNIFPRDATPLDEPEIELPDPISHSNYSSVDGDDMAAPEIERLISTVFIKAFGDLQQFQNWWGGKPHLSKLGMITKEKEGRVKRRPILDCKVSGVNKRATKGGKLVLPRVSDTVDNAPYLMKQCTIGQQIEWLILDFTD